jgi:ribonuclease HI
MHLTINTDGGSLNNPGKAAIGFIIRNDDGLLFSHSEPIGIASNNVAEYTALIKALTHVLKMTENKSWKVTGLKCIADSELMVKQLNGVYKVKNADIIPLHKKIKDFVSLINCPITFSHVLRDKNADADLLVKKALGK